MKKILAVILTVILTSSLLSVASAEQTQTIEFFCIKTEVQGVMQEIIDDFEAANPGTHVELTYAAEGETVLQTRIASNDVPDVMSIYPAERTYRAYYDEGYIIDLAGYDFMSNVNQVMLDLASYDGVQVAVPYTLSIYGIHYNKDIFEKVGVSAPTTYEELIDISRKLKEAGYDAFVLPLSNQATQITERTLSAFDGNNYKDFEAVAAGEMDIKDVKSVSALADYILTIKPYSTADATGMSSDSAHVEFMNGTAAMRMYGSWYLSTIKEANADFNVGFCGIPSPVTGETIIPVNIDTGFAVSATSEHPELALKFVEYLTQPEVATKYYQVDGNINMIKGVAYDKAEYMDVYNQVMDGKMSLTLINLWQEGTNMRKAIAAAVQALYMDEDLDAYYQTINDAIIECYE